MQIKMSINHKQNFAKQGYGVIQIHGANCGHTNLKSQEIVFEGEDAGDVEQWCGYPSAVEYVKALMDGRLDDGEAAGYYWRTKQMPCAA